MSENKLTDNEIVKALECCRHDDYDYCEKCPYRKNKPCQESLIQDSFDLINRLQAENEEQEKAITNALNRIKEVRQTAKAEAYKECIEKVKERLSTCVTDTQQMVVELRLDNLLKEMIGE